MDFFEENLKNTINAVNQLRSKNGVISVRKIRYVQKIKSTDRSKINFIWRGLHYLVSKNILEINGSKNRKTYIIKSQDKIDLDGVLLQYKRERKKS